MPSILQMGPKSILLVPGSETGTADLSSPLLAEAPSSSYSLLLLFPPKLCIEGPLVHFQGVQATLPNFSTFPPVSSSLLVHRPSTGHSLPGPAFLYKACQDPSSPSP